MPQRTILMRLRHLIEQVPDAVGVSISSKATVGAGLTGIASSMAHWNWTAIIASTVAILGLAMNYYFQRRRDKREHEYQKKRDNREEAESALRQAEIEVRRAESAARLKAIIGSDRYLDEVNKHE